MKQDRTDDLIALRQGVQHYCRDNYNNGWCDLVIETLEDAKLDDIIKSARTLKGAIKKTREHFSAYADMREDIRNA